jgi:hypothetical protein
VHETAGKRAAATLVINPLARSDIFLHIYFFACGVMIWLAEFSVSNLAASLFETFSGHLVDHPAGWIL